MLCGQSPTPGDNPFPGEQPKTPPAQQTPGTKQSPSAQPQPGQTPASGKPAGGSENPFPGEDSNAPILPAGGSSSGDSGSGERPGAGAPANSTARRDADPDGDPVRTPDPAGLQEDDGFTSSRSGLNHMPAEDDSDARPGKSTKNKTREQVLAEDLDVGKFYMDKKNWKAAQTRFASAVALDGENADAVFQLAEAERHLQLYKEAAGHYRKFLSYDPDGPHGRAARKGLDEVESSGSLAATPSKKSN